MDILKKLVRANALLLQGAYQGAEQVLDSTIVDVRELVAENARLQSSIDEANAQKPLARGYKNSITGTCSDLYWLGEAPEGETNLYTCPIPAQPSPAVAVPDFPAVEKAWSRFQSAINNGDSMIESEDSREQFYLWADEKGFCMDEVWSSVDEPFESEDTQLAWEIWQASRSFITAPSPRITEQDAREIYEVIRDIVQNYECGDKVDSMLRPLLNKLNAKPDRQTVCDECSGNRFLSEWDSDEHNHIVNTVCPECKGAGLKPESVGG